MNPRVSHPGQLTFEHTITHPGKPHTRRVYSTTKQEGSQRLAALATQKLWYRALNQLYAVSFL
jgi:hypothetical protein